MLQGTKGEKTKYVTIDSYLERPFFELHCEKDFFGYEVSEVSYVLAVYTDALSDPMARNVLDLVDETM